MNEFDGNRRGMGDAHHHSGGLLAHFLGAVAFFVAIFCAAYAYADGVDLVGGQRTTNTAISGGQLSFNFVDTAGNTQSDSVYAWNFVSDQDFLNLLEANFDNLSAEAKADLTLITRGCVTGHQDLLRAAASSGFPFTGSCGTGKVVGDDVPREVECITQASTNVQGYGYIFGIVLQPSSQGLPLQMGPTCFKAGGTAETVGDYYIPPFANRVDGYGSSFAVGTGCYACKNPTWSTIEDYIEGTPRHYFEKWFNENFNTTGIPTAFSGGFPDIFDPIDLTSECSGVFCPATGDADGNPEPVGGPGESSGDGYAGSDPGDDGNPTSDPTHGGTGNDPDGNEYADNVQPCDVLSEDCYQEEEEDGTPGENLDLSHITDADALETAKVDVGGLLSFGSGWLPKTCPAPVHVDAMGAQLDISYDPVCDFARSLSGVFQALAAVSALIIATGGGSSRT